MDIVFKNNGVLSLVDITTMGDSAKRNDSSKIGEFDSGLKYAIAILYRNGINVEIISGGKSYNFDTTIISPDHKTKEVLTVNGTPTAFSPQLGHNWEIWMAYRELYSNCIDECGHVDFVEDGFDGECLDNETLIIVRHCDFNFEIRDNWDKYFLTGSELIYKNDYVSMHENNTDDKHLRLYKNGIMVFENIDKKSQYVYDYSSASIDERRVLNDLHTFENKVSDLIMECNDEPVISKFISERINGSFESNLNYYWTFSQSWANVVNKLHLENPISEKTIYRSILIKMMEDDKFNIGYTRVSHSPSTYYYDKVTVKPLKEEVEKEKSFEDQIREICTPFEFEYKVIKSNISKFKCLPDKPKKVLYVTEDFSKDDVWEIVKAVFRIQGNDNPDYAYKQYVKLLT